MRNFTDLTLFIVLSWVIFGLITGTIASLLAKNKVRGGFVSSIILGVLGAVVGGFMANILFRLDPGRFELSTVLLAVSGALLLLLVQILFMKQNKFIKTKNL